MSVSKDDPKLTATIYRRSDGLWDWRVQAANNEIVATSGGQGFTERNDAREAIQEFVVHVLSWGVGVEEDEE